MTIISKSLIWVAVSFLLMAASLFLPAGTLAWPAGWIFLILLHGWLLVGIGLLLKHNPGLLEERLSVTQLNQKTWDKIFIILYQLLLFAWLVFMPLDAVKYHWSQVPVVLQVVGGTILIASFIVISLTFRENAFLSPTVRVQHERGQMVISTGPYRYVRHPMYAGGLLLFLGTPLLLGSWYGLLLVVLLIFVGAGRAVLEERVLSEELPGYSAYMKQVKYRFIPYVW
jgi:protein-S-isoprenylcysteine O-methyltransferase Ste14